MVIPLVRKTLKNQRAMIEARKAAELSGRGKPSLGSPMTVQSSKSLNSAGVDQLAQGVAGPSDYWKKSLQRGAAAGTTVGPPSLPSATLSPSSDSSASTTTAPSSSDSSSPASPTAKWDDEDDEWQHPPPDGSDGAADGAMLAFKAFGIATVLTVGSFGLGGWIVARLMGVSTVSSLPVGRTRRGVRGQGHERIRRKS